MFSIKIKSLSLPALLLCTSMASAQYHHSNFYNGARDGGRGGHYDRNDYHQGGIGPGKGAAIGAAGGAVLGALLGGGLKGTIIGGAAGAGIGAVVGQAHQNDQRRDRGYYPR